MMAVYFSWAALYTRSFMSFRTMGRWVGMTTVSSP